MVGVKKGDANDSWGAGLQERDLTAQPMFDKNVLAAGRSQSGEYFISTNDMNYIDRIIQIEHLGKTYDLKWEMLFSKGELSFIAINDSTFSLVYLAVLATYRGFTEVLR